MEISAGKQVETPRGEQTACRQGTYSVKRSITYGNISGCGSCAACYTSDVGASSCYDNSSPTIYAWSETNVTNTSATEVGITTIGNLGEDCGSGLDIIEYYTTCSSGNTTGSGGNPRTSPISFGSATITINACPGATLHYRLKDKNGNASSWNSVDKIGAYLIYGMEYNHFLGHVVASNSSSHIGFHVQSTTDKVADKVYSSIGSVAISNNASVDNRDYVIMYYNGILGRDPDSEGLSNWVSKLDKNEISRDQLLKTFVNGAEAQGIYNAWGFGGTITEQSSGGSSGGSSSSSCSNKRGCYGTNQASNGKRCSRMTSGTSSCSVGQYWCEWTEC